MACTDKFGLHFKKCKHGAKRTGETHDAPIDFDNSCPPKESVI